MFENFVPMVDVLHLRMHSALRADFAAQAASDTEGFLDSDLHAYFDPPRARLGSGAQGLRRKSKTSSMGF
jgi:hypothetical protein